MEQSYDLKEVGKRIRKIRISLGLSMEEFAKKLTRKQKAERLVIGKREKICLIMNA